MSLPSGYKKLEYIQSSGTQYINTRFTPDSNSRVDMVCEMLSKSGNQAPFMTRNASNGTYMFGVFSISGVFRSDYGSEKKSFGSSLSTLQKLSIIRNKNVCTIGTTTITNTESTFTALWPLFLFASNDNGTANYFSNAKIYSCQIYDNDTLIRDYIPCQTTSGEIGLWDDANGVFYGNSGTGTFTAGPVVAIAAAEADITELEYIQSDENQWIDTGVIPESQDFSIYGKYQTTGDVSTSAADNWFVTIGHTKPSGTATYLQFGIWQAKWAIHLTNVVVNGVAASSSVVEITFGVSGNTVSLSGGATYSLSNSYFSSGSYRNQTICICDGKWKTYGSKIKKGGTLVRDYIAAKLSDGTIGMYDKANSLMYINVGTGTFTAGPVVTSPSIFVNIDGIWKPINHIYVNINNIWQKST